MQLKLLRTGLITAALTAAPMYLAAQQPAPAASGAPASAAPADPAAEKQQIQARLVALQQRAAQDPGVQAASAAITTAMETADPAFKALSDRAKTLPQDVAAAQAAQDNDKLRALAAEATQLNTDIAAARQRLAANADVQAKTQAYRTALLQKMVELDPETQKLVARLAELNK